MALVLTLACQGLRAEQLAYSGQVKKQQDDVSITVRMLSDNATPYLSKRIMRRYQPVEVEITNAGSDSYALSKEHFGLPVAALKDISKKYRSRSSVISGAEMGLSVGSICGLIAGVFNPFLGAIMMPFGAAIGLGVGLIGGTIRGLGKTKKNYKELRLHATDLGAPLVVEAHTTVKKIIYVRKNKFNPQFDIALKKVA